MIGVKFCDPCRCHACLVAGVSERRRPVQPDLHGRDLARWWEGFDRFLELAKIHGAKPMQGGAK